MMANIYLIILIIFAGIPPTTELAGTSLVTTAFVAMIAFSPIVTPERIATPSPTQTFSFIIKPYKGLC